MPFTADTTRQQPFAVTFLVGWNLAVASAMFFAWPVLAPKAAAPFSWAFGRAIGAQLSVWDLPFMLMWLVPAAAAAIGWFLDTFEHDKSAFVVLVMPTVIAVATFTLFGFLAD